jgi:hypothetical protein
MHRVGADWLSVSSYTQPASTYSMHQMNTSAEKPLLFMGLHEYVLCKRRT